MKFKWEEIKNLINSNGDIEILKLAAGASIDELEEYEKKVGNRLPDSLKEFYRTHNGQSSNIGLFFGIVFSSLEESLEDWSLWKSIIEEGTYYEEFSEYMESDPEGYIKKQYANTGWLPFTSDHAGNHLGVDLDPDSKGTIGQVIAFGRDEDEKILIANSFEEFIDNFIMSLKILKYQVNDNNRWVFENDDFYDGMNAYEWSNVN